MELKWLEDFLAVAETGNFTRAAQVRNTSQAAFSRRIQQLEGWLGVSLIDRSVIPAQLTTAGENFKVTASRVLSDMLQSRADISGAALGARAGRVRLAIPYALTSALPGWWSDWSGPDELEAVVSVGNVHDLGLSILSGANDLMICFEAAHQPIVGDLDHLQSIPIGRDVLRPYCSASLIDRDGISLPWAGAAPLPLLAYSNGIYFARLVDMVIERAGGIAARRVVLENDMADVLANMAAAGHGVAWLPQSMVEARSDKVLRPVGNEAWSIPLSIVATRDAGNANPALTRLWTKIEELRAAQPVAPQPAPYSPPGHNRTIKAQAHQ